MFPSTNNVGAREALQHVCTCNEQLPHAHKHMPRCMGKNARGANPTRTLHAHAHAHARTNVRWAAVAPGIEKAQASLQRMGSAGLTVAWRCAKKTQTGLVSENPSVALRKDPSRGSARGAESCIGTHLLPVRAIKHEARVNLRAQACARAFMRLTFLIAQSTDWMHPRLYTTHCTETLR